MFKDVKRIAYKSLLLLLIITLSLSTYVFAAPLKAVTVIDGNQATTLSTDAKTIGELFEKNGIYLEPSDKSDIEMSEEVSDGLTVTVKRAIPVYVPSTGKIIVTADEFDEEFLSKNGFEVPEGDFYVNTKYNEEKEYYTLETVAYKTEITTVTEDIENDTLYVEDKSMGANSVEVVNKGKKGKAEREYIIRYENGKEVSKILTKEVVTEKPVDKILKVGTKPVKTEKKAGEEAQSQPAASPVYGTANVTGDVITTSDGRQLGYSRAITVSATAYDLSYESCGKRPGDRGYGITASGMRAAYGVIAVDPRVIPLGTRLYIAAPDGSWTYGEAVAGDTGGAIRGNKIDLFFNTRAECMSFGRRTATVYILS